MTSTTAEHDGRAFRAANDIGFGLADTADRYSARPRLAERGAVADRIGLEEVLLGEAKAAPRFSARPR